MSKIRGPGALALVAITLAACGSAPAKHAPPKAASAPAAPALLSGPQSCNPPEGTGRPGVCAPKTLGTGKPAAIGGRLVPDVSSYQGHPNWSTAKRYITGAIVKAGEGSGYTDPTFSYNWSTLTRLGIWHTAYYFVRNAGCDLQARRFVAIVGRFNSGPPVLDVEVPLPFGLASCLASRVAQLTGWPYVVTYTAPGTWPGGPHGPALLWVASYGPRPGCVWTCAHVAWQFTGDGLGPSPHSLPGIGSSIDISTDNGVTSLTHAPKPKPKPCNATCRKRELVALYQRRIALRYLLRTRGCRARAAHHRPIGPKCAAWFTHGTQVNHSIRALGGR